MEHEKFDEGFEVAHRAYLVPQRDRPRNGAGINRDHPHLAELSMHRVSTYTKQSR